MILVFIPLQCEWYLDRTLLQLGVSGAKILSDNTRDYAEECTEIMPLKPTNTKTSVEYASTVLENRIKWKYAFWVNENERWQEYNTRWLLGIDHDLDVRIFRLRRIRRFISVPANKFYLPDQLSECPGVQRHCRKNVHVR